MPRVNFRNPLTTAPIDVEPGDAFAFKVVAVVSDIGTWTAYRGPSDWSDEKVAAQGSLLLRSQVHLLFYVLMASTYIYEEA